MYLCDLYNFTISLTFKIFDSTFDWKKIYIMIKNYLNNDINNILLNIWKKPNIWSYIQKILKMSLLIMWEHIMQKKAFAILYQKFRIFYLVIILLSEIIYAVICCLHNLLHDKYNNNSFHNIFSQ